MTLLEIENDFHAAMQADGLQFDDNLIADGHIHRIRVNGEAKTNAWYVLHTDGVPAGSYGYWKTGLSHTWCAKANEDLSESERIERDKRWKQQQAERDANRRRVNEDAGNRAQAILDSATPAPDDHPYLTRKGVRAHPDLGVGYWPQGRELNSLLIPLRNAAGQLATVQAIYPKKNPVTGRDKDFLKGGAKSGAYFVIGDPHTSEVILLAEGYATAATLHEATGYCAVMACDAGNLKAVAVAFKNVLFPKKPLILCADNDRFTDGNPGIAAARKAKAACFRSATVGIAIPQFTDQEDGSDFNDLAALHGLSPVRDTIARAIDGLGTPEKTINGKIKKETPAAPEFSVEIQIVESYGLKNQSHIFYSLTVPCLETADEKGRPIIIESLAANAIAQCLKGRYAFCRESMRWHAFTGTHWYPLATAAPLEEVVTRILYAGAPSGFRARQLSAIMTLLSKGLLPLPKIKERVIPFMNGLLDPDSGVIVNT